MEESPDVIAKLKAAQVRLDENARPNVERYIQDNKLEGATMINRYVIQRTPESFLIQTSSGVQRVDLNSDRNTFSIKQSDLPTWLEEDEVSRKMREFKGDRSVGFEFKNASIGKISIGNMDGGFGSNTFRAKDVEIENVSKFTFECHGSKIEAKTSPDSVIVFEVAL